MDVYIRIPMIPRVTKTQSHRANAQPHLSEFYHINYFLPYLDYLVSELNSRFHENNDSVISNLKLIIPKYYFACETSDDKILHAAQTYEADLPHSIKALRDDVIPITTASAERSLSSLKGIITYLGTTIMGQ
ncbi:hypothetical protein QTP88_026796 [Uroleucon formosanum]